MINNCIFDIQQLYLFEHVKGQPVSKGISKRNWFIFIIDGKGNAYIDGHKYSLSRGSLVILQTNNYFAICPDPEKYISYYALGYMNQFYDVENMNIHAKTRMSIPKPNMSNFKHIEIKNAIIVENTLSNMYSLSLYSELSSHPGIKCDFYKLLSHIMDDIQYGMNSMSIYTRIEKSIQYINSNYSQNIVLSELADKCSVSKEYYIRKFKKITGVTPIQYLLSVRINKAKVLLLQGYKVWEVSEMIGFNDQIHFSKIFKKLTGVSPAYFKNSNIY